MLVTPGSPRLLSAPPSIWGWLEHAVPMRCWSPAPVSIKGKGAMGGGNRKGCRPETGTGRRCPIGLGGPADSLGGGASVLPGGGEGHGNLGVNVLVNAASGRAQHQNKNKTQRNAPRAPRVPYSRRQHWAGGRPPSGWAGAAASPGAGPAVFSAPPHPLPPIPLCSQCVCLSQGLLSWILDLPRQSRVISNCIRSDPFPQQ